MAIQDMALIGTLTIPDAAQVSNIMKLPAGVSLYGLIIPALTSCDLTLEVSHDGAAANMKPLYKADGNEWKITSTTGSLAIVVEALYPFEYVRAKSSVAQAGGDTIYIIGRK